MASTGRAIKVGKIAGFKRGTIFPFYRFRLQGHIEHSTLETETFADESLEG